MSPGPQIVAGVGTFHLLFDRLVDWVEQWADERPGARVLMQHGVSRPMRGAQNHRMLSPEQLIAGYRTADVVVLQGGAGGIMDVREAGRIPIIVPRTAALGEMVDDHQVHFMRRLAGLGVIHLAEDAATLHRLMDDAVAGQLITRLPPEVSTPGGANLSRLLTVPVPRLPWRTTASRLLWSARQILAGSGPIRPAEADPRSEDLPDQKRAETHPMAPQEPRVEGAAA